MQPTTTATTTGTSIASSIPAPTPRRMRALLARSRITTDFGEDIMTQRTIRLAQLASTKGKPGKLPVSPDTIWRWVRSGQFPAPFKLGARITVWDLDEVEAFIAKCAGDAKPNNY